MYEQSTPEEKDDDDNIHNCGIMSCSNKAPPPRLHFDDGSRIITDNISTIQNEETQDNTPCSKELTNITNPRGTTPIETYYEINHIATGIVDLVVSKKVHVDDNNHTNTIEKNLPSDGFLCKVALQFPDELLDDSAQVAWLMEEAIEIAAQEKQKLEADQRFPPLVFILGDTTYSSCCPDEIGAQHLNADVIVHYGQHACLSPTQCLPVLYSFGVLEWTELEESIDIIKQSIQDSEDETIRLLLLCERQYDQHMGTFSKSLGMETRVKEVVVGSVPDEIGSKWMMKALTDSHKNENKSVDGLHIGGLVIPIDPSSMSNYTLLYIGDDSGTSKSRQFLNTILRCSSPVSGTKACWSYNPATKQLSTDPYSILGVSRYLNRRFFLTQKAQLASIMGILVGTLSQDRFRNMVETVRRKIQDSGRGCYTFVVGKINVAKLANFAEIECFVLISCEETSVLQDERDFHVPIITPTELEIVLGEKVWGGSDSCNTDFADYLRDNEKIEEQCDGLNVTTENDEDGSDNDIDADDISDDENDEPFFSMITGTYVSKPTTKQNQLKTQQESHDTTGREGQIVEYKSEAAEFLKNREYRGLEAKIGQTEVRAAIEGQTGIASDYGK